MRSYKLSKGAEIAISNAFTKGEETTISSVCSSIFKVMGGTPTKTATTDGTIIEDTILILLNDMSSNNKTKLKVTSSHLLKLSNGIAHREWVECIEIFHLVMALSIVSGYNSELLEEYVNEEIMFNPLILQYSNRYSLVRTALSRPIHTNTFKVNRIANDLIIHNKVAIRGHTGIGKKSLMLCLVKQIVLGNYPLLYNSTIVVNPTRDEVESYSHGQTGSHIICIITADNPEVGGQPAVTSMDGISLSESMKYVYIIDTDKQDKLADTILGMASAVIDIEEPDTDETISIIHAHLRELNNYVDFTIEDEVISYIVNAANRFDAKTKQPTKSINLMMELVFDVLNHEMIGAPYKEIPTLITESTELESTTISDRLKQTTALSVIKSASKHIHISLKHAEEFIVKRFELTREVLASMMSTNVREHLHGLSEKLKGRVYGQDETLNDIVKSLWRRALRLDKMESPISFMLIGFTGVGKTFIAKKLAELMYGNETKMHRFDMSEYMERHEVSKLIGSPPGYVGSNQKGRLTEAVSKNPYTILLFDEIEKAHRDVLNIFLQVLDDGRLTDNHGVTVDFSKTIMIMTSNIGCDIAYGIKGKIGFSSSGDKSKIDLQKDAVLKEVEDYFKPEFLNRIDKLIVVNALGDNEFKSIIKTRLDEIQDSSIIRISFDSNIPNTILGIAKNTDKYNIEKYNAREIKRVVVDHVEHSIIDFMEQHDTKSIKIRGINGRIKVEEAPEEENSNNII